jgi:hypothetical protein
MPTEPVDGYDECVDAIHRLRSHADKGNLAMDVLAHIAMGTQDPELLGRITARINTSMGDKERQDRRFREIARAYNPVTGKGDMTLDRAGNYKGVD